MLSVVGVMFRTNANIAAQCVYYVVWCPKYRRRVKGGRMEVCLVKAIKGCSSRLLREEFPLLRSLWTNSYFVATVGGALLSVVKRYVENQKCR
jgi:putative transposase